MHNLFQSCLLHAVEILFRLIKVLGEPSERIVFLSPQYKDHARCPNFTLCSWEFDCTYLVKMG